jgi:hypothetical protein
MINTLNGAHTIAGIEVSKVVEQDCIERTQHSNGSTQFANDDEMK